MGQTPETLETPAIPCCMGQVLRPPQWCSLLGRGLSAPFRAPARALCAAVPEDRRGPPGGEVAGKDQAETHEIYKFICEKILEPFWMFFFSSIWSRTDFFTDIFWMGKIRLDIQTFFSSFVADMMEYKGMFWDVYVSIWMDDGPKLMGNWDNPCSWKADRSPMPMVKIRIPSCSMRIFQVHLGHLSHLGQLCSRMGSRKKLMEVALIQRWKTPQRGNSLDWNLWSPWTKVPPSQLQRRM